MNRRSFFTKLGLAAASLAILPAATTYSRKWIAPEPSIGRVLWKPNPEWDNAPYDMVWLTHISISPPIYKKMFRKPVTMRFKYGKDGQLISVPPMIAA